MQDSSVPMAVLAGLCRSVSVDAPHNTHGRSGQKGAGQQALLKRQRSTTRYRGLGAKRGVSAPLPPASAMVPHISKHMPQFQSTGQEHVAASDITLDESYFTADQFERCIVELCYDRIIRYRGDFPSKTVPQSSSSHLFADLDTFLAKLPTIASPKTPIPQKILPTRSAVGGGPDAENGHFFAYHVSVTKTPRHKRGSLSRSRSIKRASSQKRSENSQLISKDGASRGSTLSMEMLLEVLAIIVARAPEQWAPAHLIDVFKQSRGQTVQDLLEKLPSKTSQYMMFLILKISSTWIETFTVLKASRLASLNTTSISDTLDNSLRIPPWDTADPESIRGEARHTLTKKLAAQIFLRSPRDDIDVSYKQDTGKSRHQFNQVKISNEANAVEAFEVLIHAYEELEQQRDSNRGANESKQNLRYPKRKSSLAALKRNPTLTPADIPSLPLPPWRKNAPRGQGTTKSASEDRQPSDTEAYIRKQERQSRKISVAASEPKLLVISESTHPEVMGSNMLQINSTKATPLISVCIPHPISAMLTLPVFEAEHDLEQPITRSQSDQSDAVISVTSMSYPWASDASQEPVGECLTLDLQLNSELLVRAAAAAYNHRSSYGQSRGRQQPLQPRQSLQPQQPQQRLQRSRSKAKTIGTIITHQEYENSVIAKHRFDSPSRYLSSFVSDPLTTKAENSEAGASLFAASYRPLDFGSFDSPEAARNPNEMNLTLDLQDQSLKAQLQDINNATPVHDIDSPSPKALVPLMDTTSVSEPAAVMSLEPVIPLRVKSPQCKNTRRHRPPPFNLEIPSLTGSPQFHSIQELNHTMAMSFAVMMSEKPDAQEIPTTSFPEKDFSNYMPQSKARAVQRISPPDDVPDVDSPTFKKSRQFWVKPSLFLRRRSSNKAELLVSSATANKSTNQALSLPISVSTETLEGSSRGSTVVAMTAKARRHIQSKSQDFSREVHNGRDTSIPYGKPLRHVRSGTSLRSSSKLASMTLADVSSPTLRGTTRSIAPKSTSSTGDISSKAISDALELPHDRCSVTSLSAYGSPATSPMFQNDGNILFKRYDSQAKYDGDQTRYHQQHRQIHGEYESDDDYMRPSSPIRREGNGDKTKPPGMQRDSKSRKYPPQDEVWKQILGAAMVDENSNSKSNSLWTDEEDDDGGDYEYYNDYIGDGDDEFDFETGGCEESISRKAEREVKSDAHIQRVMEGWQVLNIAYAAIV
ncbi:hypothetical protein BGX27_003244 [Mortierella sp. AM989]|nr:hypothetical protein BGX27_003244 [Mortierella sp. AM989]